MPRSFHPCHRFLERGSAQRRIDRPALGRRLWFVVAAVGQTAFIAFILAFYGVRTATGNFAGWNDKPLIDGYIKGRPGGQHRLRRPRAAGVGRDAGRPDADDPRPAPQVAGAASLDRPDLPGHRRLHGAERRLAFGGPGDPSFGGLGRRHPDRRAFSILIFAGLAWRHAVKRRFDRHRRWAMRTFMVVSGVWFLRAGIMGWIVLNQGPVGMTRDMSGPADVVLTFGGYLIPLALLELHGAAERSDQGVWKALVAAVIWPPPPSRRRGSSERSPSCGSPMSRDRRAEIARNSAACGPQPAPVGRGVAGQCLAQRPELGPWLASIRWAHSWATT